MEPIRPFLHAPAIYLLALDAAAILVLWLVARGRTRATWEPVGLRILAVAGLVIPGFTVFDWYRDLAEAREWARDLPTRSEPIVERFAASSVALLSLGFLVLIAGIYLARRLPAGRPASDGEST